MSTPARCPAGLTAADYDRMERDARPPPTDADRALLWAILRALEPESSVAHGAKVLRIDQRTLERMLSPRSRGPGGLPFRIPAGIWRELADLVADRGASLAADARARGGT